MIPEENVKDLTEIPANVKEGLEIVPVKWIDRVLELALERYPTPVSESALLLATPAPAIEVPKLAGKAGRKAAKIKA